MDLYTGHIERIINDSSFLTRGRLYGRIAGFLNERPIQLSLPDHIAALLGYANFTEWRQAPFKNWQSTAEALLGPNGPTVYKMLLIQRNIKK